MNRLLVTQSKRRAMRRAVATDCNVVDLRDFRLRGNRVLDMSTRGLLVACDDGLELGEDVLVSFLTPDADPLWMDAEAEVSRIVQGMRQWDPGYCLGLRFTYFDKRDRHELLTRLAGFPPPLPRRHPRLDYAESVRRIFYS